MKYIIQIKRYLWNGEINDPPVCSKIMCWTQGQVSKWLERTEKSKTNTDVLLIEMPDFNKS